MKLIHNMLLLLLVSALIPCTTYSQIVTTGADIITSSDLESYVSFLASPYLKGRKNGSPGLEIAQRYIESNAKLLGLKPANGTSYFQPYSVTKESIDLRKSAITVFPGDSDTISMKDAFYQLFPLDPSDVSIEGELVFAGYGLNRKEYNYNDFENLATENKILLVMTGAPKSEDGSEYLFKGTDWSDAGSYYIKLRSLLFSRAKAVLFVPDPKSGFTSIDEQEPGIASELGSSMSLKGYSDKKHSLPGMIRIIFISRNVADELLKGTGKTLPEIQKKIDTELRPASFDIPGKKVKIEITTSTEEITLNNVAAYIEGSDPVLKNEYVIFSSHADHIGGSGDRINYGADDNASGCAALLSIAEAFQGLEKKPLRSIMFLWVSGEEIGLYGSEYYVNNPLVPIEKTVADLNMDMIGRVKSVADSTSDHPMSGPGEVFVITGNQSKQLLDIATNVDKELALDFNYSLSGREHPLQLFARSDHYNFVKKDIPVLFFTSGLHTDYHTPGDVVEKLNFVKMESITEAMFQIGYTIANMKSRLKVNNPFSKW